MTTAIIASCRRCCAAFEPREWQIRKSDFECPPCKRQRQNAINAADPLFREKKRARNAMPHVAEYHRQYLKLRVDPIKRKARRKVATEVEAGRMFRMPCAVCGDAKSEAHHEDYSKPLDVQWLCRKHHIAADAMLAARKEAK